MLVIVFELMILGRIVRMSQATKSKVVIVIPALNEEKTIAKVVNGAKEVAPVLVVSDGSTDNTVRVAKEAGGDVIELCENVGVDRALSVGFQEASRLGYEIVATIDADGQHDTSVLKKIIDPVLSGHFSMCHSRRDNYCRPTEWLLRRYSLLMYGLGDVLSGLKAFRVNDVFLPHKELVSQPTLGTALPWAVVDDGGNIAEVMITVRSRSEGETPRIGGLIKANYLVMKALVRLIWWDVKSFINGPVDFVKFRFINRKNRRVMIN